MGQIPMSKLISSKLDIVVEELSVAFSDRSLATSGFTSQEEVARTIGIGEPIINLLEDPFSTCEVGGAIALSVQCSYRKLDFAAYRLDCSQPD